MAEIENRLLILVDTVAMFAAFSVIVAEIENCILILVHMVAMYAY